MNSLEIVSAHIFISRVAMQALDAAIGKLLAGIEVFAVPLAASNFSIESCLGGTGRVRWTGRIGILSPLELHRDLLPSRLVLFFVGFSGHQ